MQRTRQLLSLSVLLGLALIFVAPVFADDEKEEKIALDKVPKKVMDAARKAVKGIVITEAEVEKENGKLVYELEGKVGNKEYEIEVDEDGKVLAIEQDDDDDDDD